MWYIITPFKEKCLGKELPKSVKKHAHMRFFYKNHYEYFLNHAFIGWEEDNENN